MLQELNQKLNKTNNYYKDMVSYHITIPQNESLIIDQDTDVIDPGYGNLIPKHNEMVVFLWLEFRVPHGYLLLV